MKICSLPYWGSLIPQIAGGKRYDLASMGRRRANATYWGSHGVDETTGLSYGMDMTR